MTNYNPKSDHAEEFINHDEILKSIAYDEENKANRELIEDLLKKASPKSSGDEIHCAGLDHR